MSNDLHEPDVIASRPLTKITIGGAIVLALSVVAAFALLTPAHAETPRPAPAVIGSIETTPILDGDRGRHIAADQRAELERGRWVDREGGVIDLPLDVAIERLLGDGGAP